MKKRTDQKSSPPAHLSQESQGIWTRTLQDFALERQSLTLLQQACEALDELRQAQTILRAEGMIVKDRFGAPKQHPATLVARDCRNAFLKTWRMLNLDVDAPLPSAGRPAGGSKRGW